MKKFIASASSAIAATALPLVAYAQLRGDTVFDRGGQTLPKGTSASFSTFIAYAEKVANWLFTALLIVAVIMIIIAAFRYLFAGGDETKIKKANQGLLYAAVAIAVGLLAQAIVFIVASIVQPTP
ncbi:MAG: hypothetical protein Q8Q32_01300 [bacterium]|nr:hypothetical protein [bacterium]